MYRKDLFSRFARWTSRTAGNPISFTFAILIIAIWAVTGPFYHFSDTWQLVINTSTTIVTFMMVFLIQNTQNRDSEAIQLKLDELIRAIGGAKNTLIDLEEQEEVDLDEVRESYQKLANAARLAARRKKRKASALRAAKASTPRKKPKSK